MRGKTTTKTLARTEKIIFILNGSLGQMKEKVKRCDKDNFRAMIMR